MGIVEIHLLTTLCFGLDTLSQSLHLAELYLVAWPPCHHLTALAPMHNAKYSKSRENFKSISFHLKNISWEVEDTISTLKHNSSKICLKSSLHGVKLTSLYYIFILALTQNPCEFSGMEFV
jgi:hypothetical protein